MDMHHRLSTTDHAPILSSHHPKVNAFKNRRFEFIPYWSVLSSFQNNTSKYIT